MAKYEVLSGDATKPVVFSNNSKTIIAHVCNDKSKWGSGFVVALSKSHPQAESSYRSMSKYDLGDVDFAVCGNEIVANMIGQHGVSYTKDGTTGGCPPIRYKAIYDAMEKVRDYALQGDYEIHCPKFGSDRAGGDWRILELLIKSLWVEAGINVRVYEFNLTPVNADDDDIFDF